MSILSLLSHIFTLLLLIAVICLILLIVYQEKLVFAPKAVPGCVTPDDNPPGFRNPSEHEIPYENLFVDSTDGVKLHVWLMKTERFETRPTIVFLHGNAGNVGFRLINLVQMVRHLNLNVAAVSYRGYGFSTGIPSEKGLVDDACAVVSFLTQSFTWAQNKQIILMGRSIGGAVAIQAAARVSDKILAVIVENTFLSILEMGTQIFPFLKIVPTRILDKLLRVKFRSDETIRNIPVPILFISGTRDELIPPLQMQKLVKLAKASTKSFFVAVADGTHNDTWQVHSREYYKCVLGFIEKAIMNELKEYEEVSIGSRTKNVSELLEDKSTRAPRFYESAVRQLRDPEDLFSSGERQNK